MPHVSCQQKRSLPARNLCRKKIGFDSDGGANDHGLGGAESLAELERNDYDVVLLDVRMPGMDGIEVLRRLAGRERRAEVLNLTGHASLETAMKIVRHGAFGYLLKPCIINELIAKIEQACERRSARIG